MQKDPEYRIGVQNGYYSNAKEVQSHPFFQNISMKHLKAGHYYPPFQPDVIIDTFIDTLEITIYTLTHPFYGSNFGLDGHKKVYECIRQNILAQVKKNTR